MGVRALLCRVVEHDWSCGETRRGRLVVRCRRCGLVSIPLSLTAETLRRWPRPASRRALPPSG